MVKYMKYLELKENLKEFIVFSLNDIRKIEKNFYRRRLIEWQEKGYIKKIVRGYYIFADTEINDITLYHIANKIYAPSYISLEIALSYYNLIPETVYTVTSVSTKRTYRFTTPVGEFFYRSMKPELFFGYKIVKNNNITYMIAEPEKAFLDYMYLNPRYNTLKDYKELRINEEIFRKNINQGKLISYLERFSQKKLEGRINKLVRYLNR